MPDLSEESGCGNCDNCFKREHGQRLPQDVTNVGKQLLRLLRATSRLHRQIDDPSKPGVTLRVLAQLFLGLEGELRRQNCAFYSKARLPEFGCGCEAGLKYPKVEYILAYLELSGAIKTRLVAKGRSKASYLEVCPTGSLQQ